MYMISDLYISSLLIEKFRLLKFSAYWMLENIAACLICISWIMTELKYFCRFTVYSVFYKLKYFCRFTVYSDLYKLSFVVFVNFSLHWLCFCIQISKIF